MQLRNSARTITAAATVTVLLAALLSIPQVLNPAPAAAAGSYDNASIADLAQSFNGQNGGNACQGTGYAPSGQCKQFVNCIIVRASGGAQRPGGNPDYTQSFINAGGVEIGESQATKGDIIQWGGENTIPYLHTAIVVANNGNGNFVVVDSNFFYRTAPEKVSTHSLNVHSGMRSYPAPRFVRMGTVRNSPPGNTPFGYLDSVSAAGPGKVRVQGWAADRDAPAGPIEVHVYANGQGVTSISANKPRPDIPQAHQGLGGNLGYDDVIGLPMSGSVEICTYAINVGGGGGNPQLGCKQVDVADPKPFGYLDSVSAAGPGKVRVQGWAADRDAPAGPIEVHVYANGQGVTSISANKPRPDIPQAHQGLGGNLGYDDVIGLPMSGNVEICTWAINVGGGDNVQLGCRRVDVADPNPFGSLDSAVAVDDKSYRIRGWAADPDLPAGPLNVHVYANGAFVGGYSSNKPRPDVSASRPGYGSSLGFEEVINAPNGVAGLRVCAFAINAGTGSRNTELGCAAVTITPPGAPTALSAVPDDGMAIVKFTAPPNGGKSITSYQYSLDGAPFRSLATQQSPAVIPDLRNGRAYSIRLRAVSEAGTGAASEAVVVTPAVPQVPRGFTAVAPSRLADTRTDTMVPSGGVLRVKVAGAGGIPTDAQAAALNVTVTRATGPGWITVFPCGVTAPTASNLNYVAGQTVPNAVFTGIGSTGEVCLRAQTATHVIVDANGWFGAASSFAPITPTRLTDTRTTGPVAPGSVLRVKVAGRGGIPEDASTASLNVTVTGPSASGWLTVFPCGVAAPNASSLNFVAGQTVPNSVLTGIGTGGEVCLQPSAGTHVIVDVNGWYAKSSVFTAMTPLRMADTRAQGGPLPAGGVLRLKVAGSGNVAGDAVAVSMNVTATGSAGSGWVTVYPCGGAVPQASNLNFVAGQTVPNAVVSGVGPGGEVCFYTSASTNLIVDVNGWFNPVRIAPGDINKDGTVGCSDLAILLSDWGTTRPRSDLNNDSIVNTADLSVLQVNWSDTNKC